MDTITKSMKIDIMEFDRDMALLEDAIVLSEFDSDSYFTESGDSTENFLQKAVRKVKELIKNLIQKLEEKFSSEKIKQKQKALEIKYLSDPNKANKMIKIKIDDKAYRVSKSAMDGLMKCKSKEEAEKYMEEYNKKWQKIVAASVATMSVTAAIAYLGTKLSKTKKELTDLESAYENKIKELKSERGENESLRKWVGIERKDLSITRDELKIAKSENKKLRQSNDKLRQSNDKIKSFAKNTEDAARIANDIIVNRKYDGTSYSNAIKYTNGNIDRAIEIARRSKTEIMSIYLSHIISNMTKLSSIAGDIVE